MSCCLPAPQHVRGAVLLLRDPGARERRRPDVPHELILRRRVLDLWIEGEYQLFSFLYIRFSLIYLAEWYTGFEVLAAGP